MEIKLLNGVEGAREAEGIVVIIDVFRAATTAAFALGKGASRIYPVAHRTEAFLMHGLHPDRILMGEFEGNKVEGFTFGNSPHELSLQDLTGKTMIQRTTKGTLGLCAATTAEQLYFGSFATVSALSHAIKTTTNVVSLVAMDGKGSEDDDFAHFLGARLRGENPSMEEIVERLKKHSDSKNFLDSADEEFADEDFQLCLTCDSFDFAVKAENDSSGQLSLVAAR